MQTSSSPPASTAQSDNSNAQSPASNAQSDASTAQSDASNAQSPASNAQSDTSNAQRQASTAQSDTSRWRPSARSVWLLIALLLAANLWLLYERRQSGSGDNASPERVERAEHVEREADRGDFRVLRQR